MKALQNFSNAYVSINYDGFPFIHTRFISNCPTQQEFDQYLQQLDEIHLQQKDTVTLVENNSKGLFLEAEFRTQLGHWTRANYENLKKHCRGMAFVLPSAVDKLVLRAIFMVQSPPYPYIVTDDREKAQAWLNEQLSGQQASL